MEKLEGILDLLFFPGLSHPIIISLVLPLNDVWGQKKFPAILVSYLDVPEASFSPVLILPLATPTP